MRQGLKRKNSRSEKYFTPPDFWAIGESFFFNPECFTILIMFTVHPAHTVQCVPVENVKNSEPREYVILYSTARSDSNPLPLAGGVLK